MKRSIATVSLSGTLEQKLAAVAAAGFQGVEIFETDLITFPGRPRDVAAIAADLDWGARCSADPFHADWARWRRTPACRPAPRPLEGTAALPRSLNCLRPRRWVVHPQSLASADPYPV